MAAAPSSTPALAMVLITSPVAGSCTTNVLPEMAGDHSPPMNSPSGTDSSSFVSVAFDIDTLPGSAHTVVHLSLTLRSRRSAWASPAMTHRGVGELGSRYGLCLESRTDPLGLNHDLRRDVSPRADNAVGQPGARLPGYRRSCLHARGGAGSDCSRPEPVPAWPRHPAAAASHRRAQQSNLRSELRPGVGGSGHDRRHRGTCGIDLGLCRPGRRGHRPGAVLRLLRRLHRTRRWATRRRGIVRPRLSAGSRRAGGGVHSQDQGSVDQLAPQSHWRGAGSHRSRRNRGVGSADTMCWSSATRCTSI